MEYGPPEIPLHIDLGELVRGHRVILTGLTVGRVKYIPRYIVKLEEESAPSRHLVTGPSVTYTRIDPESFSEEDRELVPAENSEDDLHFDYVPGVTCDERFEFWWLKVSDDVGTVYFDQTSLDGFDGGGGGGYSQSGGDRSDATRDIGNLILATAKIVKLEFRPGAYWTPAGPWIGEVSIDLGATR
jgi:hypothetical protein